MKELHIHEVLRMMIASQKTYTDKDDFVKDIEDKFGTDVVFHSCSSNSMNAEEAYYFLIQRGKISINQKKNIGIDPNMTMCDENEPHDHDHDHHHH